MIKNVTLKISNIHSCRQCMQAVDNTIKGLPGILSIAMKNGLSNTKIVVSYESGKISFDRIRDVIVELGYPVSGYIIHEHGHSHGDIYHSHPHNHTGKGDGHHHPNGGHPELRQDIADKREESS